MRRVIFETLAVCEVDIVSLLLLGIGIGEGDWKFGSCFELEGCLFGFGAGGFGGGGGAEEGVIEWSFCVVDFSIKRWQCLFTFLISDILQIWACNGVSGLTNPLFPG